MDMNDLEGLGRLVIAAICGAFIGYERSARLKKRRDSNAYYRGAGSGVNHANFKIWVL